jgi:hypothetical protein
MLALNFADMTASSHGRSARIQTEGGPPSADKSRVFDLDGNARKTSDESTGRRRYWDACMEIDVWQGAE